MPQGRKKTPFSGKAKKQQLQQKKQRQSATKSLGKNAALLLSKEMEESSDDVEIQKLNSQPSKSGSHNPNRYILQFHQENKEELKQRREAAMQTLHTVKPEELEIHVEKYFPPDLNFPTRPPWDFTMTKQHLESREQQYFHEYIKNLEKKFSWSELSYFELNVETWRQLWRVLEMADIVLIIVDIRFSALMFPPSLYSFVNEKLHKNVILVLNKVDLAPAPLVVAWKAYFSEKYPDLHIITFTSFPSYNIRGNVANKSGLQIRRRKGKLRMAAEGAQQLLAACKDIVKEAVDLSSWTNKIKEEMSSEYEDDDVEVGETIELKHQDTDYEEHEKYKNSILTIGCIGQPNVGKSSLMNAVMGKKVVSVSRTPGHTKHFQTIFLTENVKLCDCPGLVFPSLAPKTLQVLMGSFPIAQVREPFSVIQFLAERIDLVKLLKIQHPENDEEWSAMDICEGWSLKKGFYTARAARLDAYRGANHLLRMSLEGKIALCLMPPGYIKSKDHWASHPEVEMVEWIQASTTNSEGKAEEPDHEDESTEDETSLHENDGDSCLVTKDDSDNCDSDDDYDLTTNKFEHLAVE